KTGVKAGSVVKETAALVGGSGGGKPDIAMAGGKDVAKLSDALKAVAEIVKKLLS
ncbi:MAG: DHHA1 domain-containing protein, partial [Oscillospiraceae bacterium]